MQVQMYDAKALKIIRPPPRQFPFGGCLYPPKPLLIIGVSIINILYINY